LQQKRQLTLCRLHAAYSNDTDAVVTFSFVGVGASYLAEKRDDRGICQIQVDDEYPTYMDLYDNSGYSQGLQPIWSSGTLVYGQHNVTISQVGPDSRFGCVLLSLSSGAAPSTSR